MCFGYYGLRRKKHEKLETKVKISLLLSVTFFFYLPFFLSSVLQKDYRMFSSCILNNLFFLI